MFVLYNILKLRTYLFGLLDKDLCDSTDLKSEQLFVLSPLITWVMILGSWATARFIQSHRVGSSIYGIHKKWTMFCPSPPPWHSAKKNNRSIVQKQNMQVCDKSQEPPNHFFAVMRSLFQITLLRQLFSHLFCDRSLLPILPGTYCQLRWADKSRKTTETYTPTTLNLPTPDINVCSKVILYDLDN